MSYRLIAATYMLMLLYSHSFSQEYSYKHYNIKDGLAGSTAYCITQDKEGFLWIGTETGVSRFDGTHFKNFNSDDGLPDTEILQIFADSHGRIWMAPFQKSICYYYKGKIYNQGNDTSLKKINLYGIIEGFVEDKEGSILILQRTAICILTGKNEIKEYTTINNQPIKHCLAACRNISGGFLVEESGIIYELVDGIFKAKNSVKISPYHSDLYIAMTPALLVCREGMFNSTIKLLSTGERFDLVFHVTHSSYSILDDSLVYANESSGSTEFNIHDIGNPRIFLPGITVTRVFRDSEGNRWFTTSGQGIFRLNSDNFRNITLTVPGFGNASVYSVKKIHNELLLGINQDRICRMRLPEYTNKSYFRISSLETSENILFIDTLQNGDLICGSNMKLINCSSTFNRKDFLDEINFKGAYKKSEKELLVATSRNVVIVNPYNLQISDTIWKDRATSIYLRNDTTYIGTLNGLYIIKKDKSVVWLGDKIPFLRKRISAITESGDGSLWIASYNSGIVRYKNNQIVATITEAQGLTSDICRNIFIDKNYLWVGTDKGLNKIDIDNKEYPVTIYTLQDGLNSELINTVYAIGDTIYVGTPAGLSIFDHTKVSFKSSCKLVLLDIFSASKQLPVDTKNFTLRYDSNNIRFEYAGISYKSADKITYQYRLLGLDSSWKYTKQTFLDYPTLPSGNYQLQLIATNKFGVASNQLIIDFAIQTPFWKSSWFYLLAAGICLVSVWLFMSWRIRVARGIEKEKENARKKIIEMEYMALRAQMNPHFIFNCLNSIQQYIFDKDIFAANKYISRFARLIRTTMQNSSRSLISLSDEVEYLSTYLELEKLRFKDQMNYSIEIDPLLEKDDYYIPTMILQPYIENSIRHGIRHKTDGAGYIHIKMYLDKNKALICIIEDNGVGRKKSMSYKPKEHIEHQSKGMSLTADRIKLMNAAYGNEIKVEIIDIEDPHHEGSGTCIVLEFPLYDHSYRK